MDIFRLMEELQCFKLAKESKMKCYHIIPHTGYRVKVYYTSEFDLTNQSQSKMTNCR